MEELLEQGTEGYVIREFLRLGKQLRTKGDFKGYRNGYEPRKLKDVGGELELMIPQVRQITEPFNSRIAQFFKGHTDLLDRLVVKIYIRGLSTRDIDDTLGRKCFPKLL